MSLPRVVPPDGFEVEGVFLPGGVSFCSHICHSAELRFVQTIIGANPWVIHRQKEIFGEDCETFRPERWLEGERGQLGILRTALLDKCVIC
jgi:hypothetical protein